MEKIAVLGANDEYVQQTEKYGKKDVLFALILYAVMILEFVLLGKLFVEKRSSLTEGYIFCMTGIVALSIIGCVFMICLIRKQKFDTLGFSKKQAIKSFRVGMLLSILVAMIGIIWMKVSDSSMRANIGDIIMRIIYFLVFIGFMEELAFRGYIGTRLYGYFKNKQLSIILVGVMFSLLHIPFHLIMSQMTLLEYILANWPSLINIAILHIGFQYLYSKYNSIVAPTILHFIIDFIQWFII